MKRLTFVVIALIASSASAGVRVPDWVQAAASQEIPKYSDKIHGAGLLDETVVTVNANGEIRTVHRAVWKILGTAGRDLGMVAVPFGGDTKLKHITAWSIASSGQYQVGDRDAVETAAFDGELYADQKVKVLKIPAADPGSVLAYEYETIAKPYAMQDVWRFQSEIPVKRVRYSITLPEGWEYESRFVNAAAKEPQRTGSTIAWEMNEVAAVEEEAGAPAVHAVSGYMGVYFIPPSGAGHRTWEEVGKWYASLSDSQRAVSPSIEAKARALTANAATTYDKIAALAKFAQRDIRYVAIEIGIGGYQPHLADAILSTLYGDCKDKVTVLSAMLRAIGVESNYVLVNAERGVVDERFPSVFGFNHAIIAIKLPDDAPKMLFATSNGLLYFDPTHRYVPLGLLPTSEQGSHGLLVAGGKGELVTLPSQPPVASQLVRTAKLTLKADGSLEGEVREVRTGALAARFRSTLAGLTEAQRKQEIEQILAAHLDQHQVRDLVIENADDTSKELIVRYTVTAPNYARVAAGMVLVRPRVIGSKPDPTIDLAERKQDYLTDGPSQHLDDIEIALPSNLVADELPEPRKVTTPAIEYSSESTFEKNTLHYRRRYEVHQYVVPRDKLAELNKAFAEILADERSSAVLK